MFGHLSIFHDSQEFDSCRCSLCHALGKGYGPLARFFTNDDLALTLLMALWSGDRQPELRRRLCPILAYKPVITNNDPVVTFMAAVTMVLTMEKVRDDEHDEGLNAVGWAAGWLKKRHRKADAVLRQSGFDAVSITKAFARQRQLEQQGCGDLHQYSMPTAEVMAAIYAHTAHLAGRFESVEPLRAVGGAIGEIIYLLDSVTDFADDVQRRRFNPLRCPSAEPESMTVGVPSASRAAVRRLLTDCQQRIVSSLSQIAPERAVTTLTERLQAKFDEVLSVDCHPSGGHCLSCRARLQKASPLTLMFFPRLAMAADGRNGAGGCIESLVPLAIMLFLANAVIKKCTGRSLCCDDRPDKVTVNEGCGGKKTYRRDPCSGKYKEEGCC